MIDQQLPRVALAPVDVSAMAEETSQTHDEPWQHTWPQGTRRRVLSVDPATGGRTFLLYLPAGYGRPEESGHLADNPLGRFETHSCHEEIVNLGGQYRFGDWYDFPELGYLNHPPHWVHPADQSTSTGVLLLIKNSSPVDFAFHRIPDAWDGVEGVQPPDDGRLAERRTDGVTMLAAAELPWQPVADASGRELGLDGKHLWRDDATGWSTWLMRAPAGWRSASPAGQTAGGDELFLLEGDLSHPQHGSLTGQAYYCDPSVISTGGESTRDGFLAIRWTRAEGVLALPPLAGR